MTRAHNLATNLALGLALIAFLGVLSGCGETTAEQEAAATTAAQEDHAPAEEEQKQARDASRQAAVEEREEARAARQEQKERKDEDLAARQEQKQRNEEAASSRATGEPAPASSGSPGSDEVGSASHAGDSQFCSEHRCIGSFTTEAGIVVECSDGSYSHAGGISGACSDHGGEKE